MINRNLLTGVLLASCTLGCASTQNTTKSTPQNKPEPQIVQGDPNATTESSADPMVTQGVLYPVDPDTNELQTEDSSSTVDASATTQVTKRPLSPEEHVAADVVGYLEEVVERTAKLKSYTLNFTRYERKRSGFGWELSGPENIRAWFRHDPFSVKLKWLNDDLKYDESVYVAGQYNDMVRFVTRKPVFLLKPPPEINLIDTQTPVLIGETKRPITEFGLEGMVRRTLKSLAADQDEATVEYRGITTDPEHGQPVHHIRLTFPRPKNEPSIQDLYIDVETNLPTGSELRLADETLDGGYYYADIDTSPTLTDKDFLLSVETEPSPKTKAGSVQHE